ncbi:MAG TPA: glycosyltransferase [Candidatus Limnocylindrales bacterium]|nr:glycosyltransferase [Candidatus Limnocylindrales bacterium]
MRLRAAGLDAAPAEDPPRGVRVVLDARALQEPDRAPVTAAYLESLLAAYEADPLAGESFALILRSDLDDPTVTLAGLEISGRRLLPPTHHLRSVALALDPFLLSGISLGSAWRSRAGGAGGAVYHAVGGGMPFVTRLPLVATLLDLAPWELPAYRRGPLARFGQRLRGRLLRDAAAVIVGSEAVAAAARRVLHVRRDRLRVVPFAPRSAFAFWPEGGIDGRAAAASAPGPRVGDTRPERERLGLPERYLVYAGRYDARQDLATLLRALQAMTAAGRPDDLAGDPVWPPRILLVGASPADRASLARAAARVGVGDCLAYAPRIPDERLADLVRGARAAILPARSDATGLPAIEAIACGTPVVASSVGALPEAVGTAGILVPPLDPERLATALGTIWTDDGVHRRLAAVARERAESERRTWADVARDTRRIYAEVAAGRGSGAD